MLKTSTILAATGITVATSLLVYVVYFDYKRRNDSAFRKRLRSQKKKVEQSVANEHSKQTKPAEVPPDVLRDVLQQAREEQVPESADERERFFMSEISKAEKLTANGPQSYLDAALCFYRALRVYPSQMELLLIYQKTVPEPILVIVMEMYNLDVISRIKGYYDHFPPKSMNVVIQQVEVNGGKGTLVRKQALVAAKDIAAGEEIYKESPVLAVLDADIQAKGTHCSHCLRSVQKGMAIRPESDLLKSVYCSKKCQMQAKVRSHNFLFGSEPPVPPELDLEGMSPDAQADRRKAQNAFVAYLENSGKSGPLLVARFVAMQVAAETAKLVPPGSVLRTELLDDGEAGEYSFFDHMERLRYLDMSIPDGEWKLLRDVLQTTLPGLEQSHTDERHAVFRGKMAYNAIGVCFAGGRDGKPVSADRPEDLERTRTPYGTSRQIGSGIYFVSSYIGHSCVPCVRPSFSDGTSELHLIATRNIAEGEQLTMAYVDVSQRSGESVREARERRRYEIARGWRFGCACPRCEEGGEEDSLSQMTDGSKLEAALTSWTA